MRRYRVLVVTVVFIVHKTAAHCHFAHYFLHNTGFFISVLEKSAMVSDEKYPAFSNYGFYFYYDEKSPEPLKYVGQSYGKSKRTLGKRIRWEIVKDGSDGSAVSKFTQKCQKYSVDKLDLTLEVGHIKEPPLSEHSPQLMNDIEMALIFKMQPIMNDRGKKRYRRGPIEIFNEGNFAPLPEIIRIW
jgi:hypothetical protein